MVKKSRVGYLEGRRTSLVEQNGKGKQPKKVLPISSSKACMIGGIND